MKRLNALDSVSPSEAYTADQALSLKVLLTQIGIALFFLSALCLSYSHVYAQEQSNPSSTVSDDASLQMIRLNELTRLIDRKIEQRDAVIQLLEAAAENALSEERAELQRINREIANLKDTFELIALGDMDISLLQETDQVETTWQEDLLDILKPLIESLQSITKRPRQIADLRESIADTTSQLATAQQAIAEIESITERTPEAQTAPLLADLLSKWQDEMGRLEQENLVTQAQLNRLIDDQQSFVEGIWPSTQSFLLGRGLTVLLLVVVALAVWLLMRLLWWIYTTRFTTRTQRRSSTWFRVLAYSYYLFTSLVVVGAILVVLYVREDLLLLALAFLILAGATLSFRHFLPQYVREARLLLNLGAVREDERVVYNGLPWRVNSLNLYTVLYNPELEGVIRLPLDMVSSLVSRPVKNNLWFPSSLGDYVILPDGLFGQIKHQTPDLVEINVRGGMSMTYNTTDFYALNLINLSRDKTFGVSITFGFDYAHQAISLTSIPQTLYTAIENALHVAGYENTLKSLIVELSSASASSLDYLVFATMDSQVASDFYKIERILQQTCVAVSNEQDWTIPFPQLTVHQSV